MSLFYPTLYRRRITDVTVEDLQKLHVQGILLDVDNTLTTHDCPDLDPAVTAWLEEMKAAGFRLAILSNNSAPRVAPFADKIGLGYYAKAKKPLPGGYKAAAVAMELLPKACVAIGDQIFTDIIGANLAGMPCILLEPIQPEVDQKFIVFKRRLERPLLGTKKQMARKEKDYANTN